jgi:hypothetical protein
MSLQSIDDDLAQRSSNTSIVRALAALRKQAIAEKIEIRGRDRRLSLSCKCRRGQRAIPAASRCPPLPRRWRRSRGGKGRADRNLDRTGEGAVVAEMVPLTSPLARRPPVMLS